MTIDRYFVVRLEDNDLYYRKYDYYEDALDDVKSDENKAIIIRCENICMDGNPGPKFDIEDHT